MKTFGIAVLVLILAAGVALAAKPKVENAGCELVTVETGSTTREGGETITTAFVIPSLPFNDSGDTSDNTHEYDAVCGWAATAPDVIYSYTPAQDTAITASLCDSGYDTKLYVFFFDGVDYLVIACNDDYEGEGCTDLRSRVENVVLSGGVTYYIAVDGYETSAGPYVLDVVEVPMPGPVDFCGLSKDGAAKQTVHPGDTCGSQNLISFLDCGTYIEAGVEDYFEIHVPAGGSFTATLTFDTVDGALWLIDGCAEPFSCLAYADDTESGLPETVAWSNEGTTDAVLYLVVDAYGGGACGTYELAFAGAGGSVAARNTTLSGVKAIYRP